MLRIRLLGEVDVREGAERVRGLESPRLRSLLAYLLLHRDAPQDRQRVAAVLWPDSTEAQARTNLRQLLHHLRRTIPTPDRYLDVAAQTIQWRPESAFTLDVAEFETAADRGALTEAAASQRFGAGGLRGHDRARVHRRCAHPSWRLR